MQSQIREHFDKTLSRFSSEKYLPTLLEAKKTYFNLTGVALEEDDDYEERMSSFNCWYLFSFRHPSWTGTPIEMYLAGADCEGDVNDALKSVSHSLFEYGGKNMRRQHVLWDILHDKKISLSKETDPPPIVKNDIFLARTVKCRDEIFLMPGLVFLPTEVRHLLKKQAKKVRKSELPGQEPEFLRQVEFLKTKWRRYGHLEATKIFDFSTFGSQAP